jgi:hypothetical protein
MGRGSKQVLHTAGIDRRISGYYSTPRFVADFMAEEFLRHSPHGQTVLDPCAGQGELHDLLIERHLKIDSFDVVDFGIDHRSNFQQRDFLDYYDEQKSRCIMGVSIDAPYDFYIANPPYNCHEVDYIRERKTRLKQLFPNVGVHNMYSMFVSAMIDCAKDGAIIGFITLDSFLTSRVHYGLRKQILDECAVHTIALCPTDLFLDQKSDVRTCILVLQKGKRFQGRVRTSNRPRTTEEFRDLLKHHRFVERHLPQILLHGERDQDEVVIGCPDEIADLFKHRRLGEQFRCVTGISTADDNRYLSKVRSSEFDVPFFKNPGMDRFRTKPSAYLISNFLDVEREIADFQVRNKDVLFKEGITCSSMGVPFTACYLPPNSTFGVNANIFCDAADLWWLIGFLNSSLVTFIVRGILIRTNMITSGYVSRIPIPPLTLEARRKIARVAQREYERRSTSDEVPIREIDEVVYGDLHMTAGTQSMIAEFCGDLVRLT